MYFIIDRPSPLCNTIPMRTKKPYVYYKEESKYGDDRQWIGIPGASQYWSKVGDEPWNKIEADEYSLNGIYPCGKMERIMVNGIKYSSELKYKHPKDLGIKEWTRYKSLEDPDFIIDQL